MKIQFKKELHNILEEFHERTKEPNKPWLYYIHGEYRIGYHDIETIFDVQAILIKWNDTIFICFHEKSGIFDFFWLQYFDIIDYSIPNIWAIGGFPRNYLFEYMDGSIWYNEFARYYWGYPIFFSDYFLLDNYYDNRGKYHDILAHYSVLDISENSITYSSESVSRIIDTIRQLP